MTIFSTKNKSRLKFKKFSLRLFLKYIKVVFYVTVNFDTINAQQIKRVLIKPKTNTTLLILAFFLFFF